MRIFRLGMGEIKSLHSCTVKHSVYIFIETRSSQRLNRSNKYQKYVVFPSSGGIIRPQSQIQLGTTKPWEPCECIDRLKHNTSLWNWFDFHRIVPEQEWQKIRQEYLNTDWTGGLLVKVHLCFWTRYLSVHWTNCSFAVGLDHVSGQILWSAILGRMFHDLLCTTWPKCVDT